MVSAAERSAVMETVLPHREETPHGIDLDGHCARQNDDASRGSGGAERHDFEGTIAQGPGASEGVGNAPGSHRAVAGATGDSTICREAFLDDGGALYSLVWVPAGAHRRRRHRLEGLGSFRDLERLVIEEVAR
jgi:hypothetical protein